MGFAEPVIGPARGPHRARAMGCPASGLTRWLDPSYGLKVMGIAEPVIGPATSGRTLWLNPSYGLSPTRFKDFWKHQRSSNRRK